MIGRLGLVAWRALRGVDPRAAVTFLAIVAGTTGVGVGFAAVNRWFDTRAQAQIDRQLLAAEIERLEEELVARDMALQVLRAHRQRLERAAADRRDTLRYLETLENADAPLPDPLARASERLWGAGQP